jgi:hypothetical protein
MDAKHLARRMAQHQAQLIRQARGLDMGPVPTPALGGEGYTLIMRPDGTVEMKVWGRADGSRSTNGIDRIGSLMVESYVQRLVTEAVARLIGMPATKPDAATGIPVLPIGKVVTRWLADIGSSTLLPVHVLDEPVDAERQQVLGIGCGDRDHFLGNGLTQPFKVHGKGARLGVLPCRSIGGNTDASRQLKSELDVGTMGGLEGNVQQVLVVRHSCPRIRSQAWPRTYPIWAALSRAASFRMPRRLRTM